MRIKHQCLVSRSRDCVLGGLCDDYHTGIAYCMDYVGIKHQCLEPCPRGVGGLNREYMGIYGDHIGYISGEGIRRRLCRNYLRITGTSR